MGGNLHIPEQPAQAHKPIPSRDWDRIRIEASIAAMQAMIEHPKSGGWTEAEIAHDAVQHAEALVNELRWREAEIAQNAAQRANALAHRRAR